MTIPVISNAPSPFDLSARSAVTGKDGIIQPAWMHALQAVHDEAESALGAVNVATHAQRLASLSTDVLSLIAGSLIFETDRLVTYLATGRSVGTEVYSGGVYAVPFANIPTDLGPNDAGFLLFVTDFSHLFRWDGAAWAWGPGDPGSGFIVAFGTGLSPVPATGWQKCDTTPTTFLRPSGGGINNIAFVTPNTAGSWFRR